MVKTWPLWHAENPQSQPSYMTKGYKNIPKKDATFLWTFSDSRNWCWPDKSRKCTQQLVARLIPGWHDWLQAFPFQQFHVLFNSLFKVLFIFPSRYLFAIGLSPIFSFRWNLPPILSCIPKQLDSLRAHHKAPVVHVRDGILTLYDAPFQETCTWSSTDSTSLDYNSDSHAAARFQIWALPASLAVTRGILVSFFSSAYWYA